MNNTIKYLSLLFLIIPVLTLYSCGIINKRQKLDYATHITSVEYVDGVKKETIIKRSGVKKLEGEKWDILKESLMKNDTSYHGAPDEIAVVFYYPGKDKYNSTGGYTEDDIGRLYSYYISELNKVCDCTQFNFYKNAFHFSRRSNS